jgi:methylmalonyl-CoA mutase N-terminal domain/subunit
VVIAEIDEMGGGAWSWRSIPGAAGADGRAPSSRTHRNAGGYGGVVAGINRGYFRRHIAEASYRYAEECEAGDRIIVGVNEYVDPGERRPIEILTIPDSVETEQVERLAAFRKRRDAGRVGRALDNLRAACRGERFALLNPLPLEGAGERGAGATPDDAGPFGLHATNVMPALIDAALCDCTLGEMVQAMADVHGRYSGGPEW